TLPVRSPNLNAYSERWVRSVREECLSKVLLIGERCLRLALSEYVAHYHAERNHPCAMSRKAGRAVVPWSTDLGPRRTAWCQTGLPCASRDSACPGVMRRVGARRASALWVRGCP